MDNLIFELYHPNIGEAVHTEKPITITTTEKVYLYAEGILFFRL